MPDRVQVRATRNGGLDFIEVPTIHEAMVAALLRERAGYVLRGLSNRVEQVDAELRRLGVDPPADNPGSTQSTRGTNEDDRQERERARRRHRQRPGGEAAAGNV